MSKYEFKTCTLKNKCLCNQFGYCNGMAYKKQNVCKKFVPYYYDEELGD